MEKKIKWGVLGWAKIARKSFIPALLKASNAEFSALASRTPEHLDQCRQEYGTVKTYADYDHLLADPEIQAVYIPLPNASHREWTLKAARQGKHILCEKPLALNAHESEEMIAECAKYNVKLMEAFMYRYTDRQKKLSGLLKEGRIGQIKQINTSFRFMMDRENDIRLAPELGGGCLYDVGCYTVNFAGMITQSSPESIAAECITQGAPPREVDVSFSATMKYADGVIATIDCGFNSFSWTGSEIIGTRGVIAMPETFSGNPGKITVTTQAGPQEIPVFESDRFLLEVEDFSGAILNDRPPLISLDETLRNMRIIDRLLHHVNLN